ncbi:MAG TPA: MgtC/SapB family protein, partial [Inquilinus sp.]
MDETSSALRLGAALAVGLIIGLERGWTDRDRPEGRRAAGLRTFAITGFGAGIAAFLAPDLGPGPLLLFLAGIGAYMLAAYLREAGSLGLTTEVALLVTALLGAAAGIGHDLIGVGGAVVVALLLREKARLHDWLERFTPAETAAVLQFLLIAVVVPPFLPDRTLDPWEAINPAKIWWLVVLVAGLSFAGYAAVRIAGPRVGTLLTGLLG